MHDQRPPRGPRQAGASSSNQNMASLQSAPSPSRQHSEGMSSYSGSPSHVVRALHSLVALNINPVELELT
jgi:hypothetical protein